MPTFPLLADPARYVACTMDLLRDAEARTYWIEFFKRHLEMILKLGLEERAAEPEVARRDADACRIEFVAFFDDIAARPDHYAPLTILRLDEWRDRLLRKHGFVDPFSGLKRRENQRFLPLLAGVCAQIDSLEGLEQLQAVVEGVFAGNIFDMGAAATAKVFLNSSPDFFATRAALPRRPWLVDDFDALVTRLLHRRAHRKAVFFIDNAGSDFLLGAIPMIRWLAQRGTRVVLASNERPTLNDMTHAEVQALWPAIVAAEPSLGSLPIERVSTGTGEPLIDLSAVSQELVDTAADADLVILEGMGRGIESNFDAAFTCDALNLAMIKDEMIARRLGGKVFDVVCKVVCQ